MLASAPGTRRITVGADRGYDTRGFVRECRNLKVTPHVAQKQRSAIDRRTTRHDGYRFSQRARKRIEEVFRWVKTVGGGRKLRYCGIARNRLVGGNDHRRLQPGASRQTDGGHSVSPGISLS